MSTVKPIGPSPDAGWGVMDAGAEFDRPLRLRFLPDLANDALENDGQRAVGYALRDQPVLAANAAGAPVLSLTLVLSRQPSPDEDSIDALVQSGVITFDVTLASPRAALKKLSCEAQVDYRPLFTREARFSLLSAISNAETLAVADTAGTDPRVGLSANLSGDDARSVLAALNGYTSDLRVTVALRYPAAGGSRTICLQGSWATIHDFLAKHLGYVQELDGAQLKQYVESMLRDGVLRLFDLDTNAPLVDAGRACPMFIRLSSVVLQRLTPELASADERNQYALRQRPHSMFELNYQETLSVAQEGELTVSADLADVVGGRLPRDEWDKYVRLVAPDTTGGIGVAPRRVHTRSQRRILTQTSTQATRLAAVNNRLQSVTLAVSPNIKTTTSLHANVSLRPAVGEVLGNRQSMTWFVDDMVLDHYKPAKPVSLPLVQNTSDTVWPDRFDKSLYWYAPEFSNDQPSPAGSAETSGFLFDYEVIGATASGAPALKGIVRITLIAAQPDEIKRKLRRLGNPTARMISIKNLSVALEVPFVDEHGVTRAHRFPATIKRQGSTFIATVELLNDWVRICYGALAIEGFQRDPARLLVSYTFPAYSSVTKNDIQLVFGGKTALTPVLYNANEVANTKAAVFVDAATATVHMPAGALKLKREILYAQAEPESLVADSSARAMTALAHAAVQPAVKPIALSSAAVVACPMLASAILPEKQTRFVYRSIARQENLDAFYSCETLGMFYRKKTSEGAVPIGCRDALKLGHTVYRQYDEIVDLQHNHYGVYRSLQQPGRFLVVPKTYAITRHAPGREMAYLPCGIFYSVIDTENEANNLVFFECSLEPDIPAFERKALENSLRSYAQAPIVDYPTQVFSDADYRWTISEELSEPTVIEFGDSLRISLSNDLIGGHLMEGMLSTGGIKGVAEFKLADGSMLQSDLSLNLNRIIGPWERGPLQVTASGTAVQIVNRIEQPVTVTTLHRYDGGAAVDSLPVNVTLSKGQSHVVTVTNGAGEWYPEYFQQSASATTLQESRVFVENVTTNVVFFVLLNYANHGLQALEIRARLKDESGTYTVPLSGEPKKGDINIMLPLTDYLQARFLQFQVTKIFTDATRSETDWIDWDLLIDKNIITVYWDMISD